jgi:hypothetical protein
VATQFVCPSARYDNVAPATASAWKHDGNIIFRPLVMVIEDLNSTFEGASEDFSIRHGNIFYDI